MVAPGGSSREVEDLRNGAIDELEEVVLVASYEHFKYVVPHGFELRLLSCKTRCFYPSNSFFVC